MKSIFAILVFMFAAQLVSAQSTFLSGAGTVGDPYLIGSVNDLKFFRDQINLTDNNVYDQVSAYFQLTADLDLSAESPWQPIGNNPNSQNNFKGHFDGNNKTISNLTNGTSGTRVYQNPHSGFFGTASNSATIKNLTLSNISFYLNKTAAGNFMVGGLAGQITAGVRIENCHVSGVIDAINSYSDAGTDMTIGGLVGYIQRGSAVTPDLVQIINSSTYVNIVALSTSTFAGADASGDKKIFAAGIVGNYLATSFVNAPEIINSYSKGSVEGESTVNNSTRTSIQQVYVAGVWANNCGKLYNCYASGNLKGKTVTANVNACGIAGFLYTGTLTKCYAVMDAIDITTTSGTQVGRRISNGAANNQVVSAYSFENTKLNGVIASNYVAENNSNGLNITAADFITGLNAYVSANPTNNGVNLKSWATVSASSNDVSKGTVSGSTNAFVGQTVTLKATPLSGKTFVRWSEGGTEVSTNDKYSFTVSTSRTLVAEFLNNTDPNYIAVESVAIQVPPFSSMQVGTSYQLIATITPFNATNMNILWNSSNSAVATIGANGLVSAINRGKAIITAKAEDGNITASFTVYVYSNTLSLASLLTDNMVLQQNTEAVLWGWTSPNTPVQISGSWGQNVTATADNTGKWMKKIQTPAAVKGDNQPKYTLTFTGPVNSITVQNILIGDVYLCSGQSNMLYPMKKGTQGNSMIGGVDNYATEIAMANYPNIRYNDVDNNQQPSPVDYRSSTWTECNSTNAQFYSAVSYYFAKELYADAEINIPIGLVVSAVGATRCQAWTSREAMASDPTLKATYLDPYDQNPSINGNEFNTATIFYNGQIAPLIPFTIKGFLWYQGEGNSGETTYTKLFSAMITDWRARWGQGNLPFYYVQLAPYYASTFHITREQQTNTLILPNTGMVVITDIVSDLTDIHPTNKKDVGNRLALWAKAKIYGQKLVYTGPMYKSMKVEGNKIRITFHPASIGSGLETIGGGVSLNEFTIGGADNIMVAADAVIDGNDVLVSAASVPNPTNVWFAYKKDPLPTLRNKEGLPACPFRTNGWDNSIDIPSNQTSEVHTPNNLSIQIKRIKESTIISGFPIGKTMHIYNLLGIQVYAKKVSNKDVHVILPKGIYVIKDLGKPFLVQ